MLQRFGLGVTVGGVLAALGFPAREASVTWAIILWGAALVSFLGIVLPGLVGGLARQPAPAGDSARMTASVTLHKRPTDGVPSVRYGLGDHGAEQYLVESDGLATRIQFIEPVRRTVTTTPQRVLLWPRFWQSVEVVAFTPRGVVLTDHAPKGTAVEFRYWGRVQADQAPHSP